MPRQRWAWWLVGLLSLSLLILTSGISGGGDESPATAEEVTTVHRTGSAPSFQYQTEIGLSIGRIGRWVGGIERSRRAEAAAEAARRAAEARRAARVHASSTRPAVVYTASTGRCGGDLPPCWVMNRESGGNINAYNPTGCGGRGCRGKWQCDPRTCSGTGTEEQQDAEARAVWDGGRGCRAWNAC